MPTFYVPKKENPGSSNITDEVTMRTVSNYKALQPIRVRSHYPPPLILDLLDRLQSVHILTKLGLEMPMLSESRRYINL